MFFFFKQKTAYEMRISDWSSDVCSSDLRRAADSTRLIGLARARARWQDRPMERRITHSCGHEQTNSIYGMFAADAGSLIAMRLMTDCSCLYRSVTSPTERQRVVRGNSGSGRVTLGGSRTIYKTKK